MSRKIDLVFSAEGGSPARGGHGASGGKNYANNKAPGQSFFKNVLETAAKELKLKCKAGVSINLVSEAKIKELNRKYRNKNKPTDVLSFPLNEKFEIRNSKFVIQDLGDIFICLSIAKSEAKRENITIKQKLAQLTAHGFLHLNGYNHEKSKRDAEKMFELEKKVLQKLYTKNLLRSTNKYEYTNS